MLSRYQEAVIASMATKSNKSIRAVAGSGKSYTLKRAVAEIPATESVLVAAFNRKIANALVTEIKHPKAVVKTINAFGSQICRAQLKGQGRIDADKTATVLRSFMDMNDKDDRTKFYRVRYSISRLVDLFRAMMILDPSKDLIIEYSDNYGLDIPTKDPTFFELVLNVYRKCLSMHLYPDFRDQTFMPLYLGLTIQKYDWGLIDEAQDLDPNQAQLLMAACRNIILFGDPNQAIYGFKGAMAEAMEQMESELKADLLPLSICYRCPKSVVRQAKTIVPQIEACDWAPEGENKTVTFNYFTEKAVVGDFVICRNTAPLVHHCLKFIRAGRKALVEGRDIGVQLVAFIKARIASEDTSIGNFNIALESYYMEQMARLTELDREQQKEQLSDRVATIRVLMEGVSSVRALIDRIQSIFTDSATGAIIFMTAHKSKGLEASRVWILEPKLLGRKQKKDWSTQQERNLLYVAMTRVVFGPNNPGSLYWIE